MKFDLIKNPYMKSTKFKINLEEIRFIIIVGKSFYIKKKNGRSKTISTNEHYKTNLKSKKSILDWKSLDEEYLVNDEIFLEWITNNFELKKENELNYYYPINKNEK